MDERWLAQRQARHARSATRTSLLSVSSAAGIESVGLTPVGDVLGTMVEQIAWRGLGNCGHVPGRPPTTRVSSRGGAAGFAPYATALERGFRTALTRLRTEAVGVGADGVVGVRLTRRALEDDGEEFSALGTAVRARGRVRPLTPFLCELGGPEVAALMQAGWVPVTVAVGVAVGIRHDDQDTLNQTVWRGGNTEVDGYTDLAVTVRAGARRQFDRAVSAAHADGAVGTRITFRAWCQGPDGHRDHAAEATVTGTAIARFARGTDHPTTPLTIVPLGKGHP